MSLLGGLGLEAEAGTPDEPGVASVDDGLTTTPTVPLAPAVAEAEETIELPEGAQNPDAVTALIRAERKLAKEANARARELEKQAADAAEAAKPLAERVSSAEQKAQEAELRALRLEVGVGLGLTPTLSRRLSGTTAEELATDAAALIAELGTKPTPHVPGLDGGVKPPPPPANVDPSVAHSQTLVNLITRHRTGA